MRYILFKKVCVIKLFNVYMVIYLKSLQYVTKHDMCNINLFLL